MSDFGSGNDLTVPEFEPRTGLCADNSEPGVCFRFCVSLPLFPYPAHTVSLFQKSINIKKINKKEVFFPPLSFIFISGIQSQYAHIELYIQEQKDLI